MKLGDQLTELRNNILRDRSDLVAGESDSRWDDDSLLRYIGEGERKFARETMCLRDGTTPKYTRLTLREGVKNYPLDVDIFALLSARPSDQDYDLQRTGRMLVQSQEQDSSLTFDPAEVSTIPPGRPLGVYTDETAVYAQQHRVTLSVYPTPSADETGLVLNLRVVRVPCSKYTTSDLDRESEIPPDYQLDVLEWAAYRAKRNNDADIGETPNADSHKAAFEEAIARCKRDMRRRMHVATGVRYGRNGFSWGR